MRKLCHTEKWRKKKKKSHECSMASISSGWLGEDKTNIKKEIKQNTTTTILQAFLFSVLQVSKLLASQKPCISQMITLSLALVIKADVTAKQGLCREGNIENIETCIWPACIPKATQTKSYHCGKKHPFNAITQEALASWIFWWATASVLWTAGSSFIQMW